MTLIDATAVLVTTVMAVLALWGLARVCHRLLANPLDRVASVALIVTGALFGVFALGEVAMWLPARMLNLLLLANPIVAAASAADLDIFHGALLYNVSPIAHRDFHYPAWQAAALAYGCTATVAFLAARAHRRRASLRSTH